MEVVVTTGAISRAKRQSNHHHQQTNIQFFTDWMPFLSPNQQCQSIEGNITSHGLAYPKFNWGLPTLSLTINSSRLPWGRFAMPHQPSGASTPSNTAFLKAADNDNVQQSAVHSAVLNLASDSN